MHISVQVKKNCWNMYDSYGEICVHCGCCSNDAKTRQEARLEVLNRWLKEEEEHLKDPTYDEFQIKNIKSNIRYTKRHINYYKRALEGRK